ncbi:immunoglobulin-binding protein 1 [Asbolus verrucosus]|uniref:Immunoglobulin-binding protein 1 n=1 Tax=Asbolus verrucosus TaxID=1661398 RepID=A0A482W9G0_ASBVE|nr:immunoglobulin-binding protein 1 [Asbolus verrucosus]
MANSNDFDDDNVESLSTMFNEGLDLYNKICNNDEPTNSPSVQMDVKTAMRIFEKSTRLVSYAGIFSNNEGVEEIATNDLQYFLLPALLGSLSLKLTSGERKDIIEVAEIYFKDFLNRCNDYSLSNYEFKNKKEEKQPQSEFEQIAVSVNTRASKIQRYKEQKDLKLKLADLKKNMEKEHADEEIKRDYFLTMLKLFIHEAVIELNSIENEKPILEYMANMKKDEKPERKRPPAPLKPIIITKDEIQKAVFGAGYPSLPTMTVQEFYDKRVKDGIFPDPTKQSAGPVSLQQAALSGMQLNDEEKEVEAKEIAVEEDNPEYMERMRHMDEFKDEHRRGWGNRMNRS